MSARVAGVQAAVRDTPPSRAGPGAGSTGSVSTQLRPLSWATGGWANRRVREWLWQTRSVAEKTDLKEWVEEALRELGPAKVVEVSRWVWEHREAELRASGSLFYTWQYDLRWAAQALRDEGRLALSDVDKLTCGASPD